MTSLSWHLFFEDDRDHSPDPTVLLGWGMVSGKLIPLESEILNSLPDGVLMTDREGIILFASRSCAELLGYTVEELVGQAVEQLVPLSLRVVHRAQRELYQQTPQVRSMQGRAGRTVALTKSGQELAVDIKLSPVDGCILAVVRDARPRLEAEKELRQTNQALLRLDAQRSQFLGVLAHDLRSPLSVSLGYARMLLAGRLGTLQPAQEEALEQVRQSAEFMLRLVNDLLDASAIEQGVLTLRRAPTRLLKLVEQTVARHRLIAASKGQSIQLSHQGDDPELSLDETRILQVLDNLLSNAIKFSPPGQPIEVTLSQDEQEIQVAVRDHGPGVPEKERDNLFRPYTTCQTSPTGSESSTGLGLAIVYKITLGHGGRVWYEPAPQGGVVFKLAFPRV